MGVRGSGSGLRGRNLIGWRRLGAGTVRGGEPSGDGAGSAEEVAPVEARVIDRLEFDHSVHEGGFVGFHGVLVFYHV